MLLLLARSVGLSVEADGDELVIRGPRDQGAFAHDLLAKREALLGLLAEEAEGSPPHEKVEFTALTPFTSELLEDCEEHNRRARERGARR